MWKKENHFNVLVKEHMEEKENEGLEEATYTSHSRESGRENSPSPGVKSSAPTASNDQTGSSNS